MADSDDAELREFCARGRAAWPEITAETPGFEAFVSERLATRSLDQLHAADLYLAYACTLDEPRALAALDDHFIRPLSAALGRVGASATAEDVLQLLRIRFLVNEPGQPRRIAGYDGTARLSTWLRVAAVRIAISAFRKQRREPFDDAPDEVLDMAGDAPDPALALAQHAFSAEFRDAFRGAFAALETRERILLRHHTLEQLNIDRIAALHGVHRATAARWLGTARENLLANLRRELRSRLDVSAEQLDSMLESFRSQLEISVRMLLTPVAGG